jgi:hypothetical protein
MVIRLDIEIWIIGKGGIKKGRTRKRVSVWGKRYGGC